MLSSPEAHVSAGHDALLLTTFPNAQLILSGLVPLLTSNPGDVVPSAPRLRKILQRAAPFY